MCSADRGLRGGLAQHHGEELSSRLSQSFSESECHSSSSSHEASSGPRWADMSDSEDDQDHPLAKIEASNLKHQLEKVTPLAKIEASNATANHAQVQPRWGNRGKAVSQPQPDKENQSATPTRVRNPRNKGGARNKQQIRGHDTKHQCQFFIGIEEEAKFRVVRRVIGTAGANVKYIAEQAGPDTKLRLRGRGSKFFEGPEKQESPEPLMMCVSVPNRTAYEVVTRLVREQLERVYDEYDAFRVSNGQSALRLRVRMHEGPRSGSR